MQPFENQANWKQIALSLFFPALQVENKGEGETGEGNQEGEEERSAKEQDLGDAPPDPKPGTEFVPSLSQMVVGCGGLPLLCSQHPINLAVTRAFSFSCLCLSPAVNIRASFHSLTQVRNLHMKSSIHR